MRRGFTLVELMISLVVLCIGVLALAGTMSTSQRLQYTGRSRDELTTLADTKLEQLRSAAMLKTADTVQLAVGGSLTGSLAAHADTVTLASGRRYFRRWTVAAGAAGARAVTLRVQPQTAQSFELRWLDFTALILVP